MNSDIRPPDQWLSFALAFVGGYGDAASVVLTKTFTGHVTGSLVFAAIALASQEWHALLTRLLAVVSFWPEFYLVCGLDVLLPQDRYLGDHFLQLWVLN